jgi:hypothetical protein
MRLDIRLIYALAVVAGSCRSTTEPLGEVYVLRSIAGVPMPAPYAPNLEFSARKIADTLFLGADGTGDAHTVMEESLGGRVFTFNEGVTYTRRGNDVEVSYECPPNALALCVAPPHLIGKVTATGIQFVESRVSRAPLVYERVR